MKIEYLIFMKNIESVVYQVSSYDRAPEPKKSINSLAEAALISRNDKERVPESDKRFI